MRKGVLNIWGLDGIPEVQPGDDLVGLIIEAGRRQQAPQDGDVVVVTHKIVSKAEGRIVDLRTIVPSLLARRVAETAGKDARQIEVVLREATRIVRMDRGVIIAETRHGFVCANAGVDASNVADPETVCLLPENPDDSARRLRLGFQERLGVDVAVIISDSFGRPWRNGVTNVAIGLAGMMPFADYRGQTDPNGYLLKASVLAVADELAASAELVMRKLDRKPVAVIRGFDWEPSAGSASDLVMESSRDMFR